MRIRFGEGFVADLDTGELFRNGRLRRLQDKPFRLLELLLSRPSRLARYDEIERHLWPDVKVEARHSIKEAAQKVRRSLGADARRLQCLRGRGYRLMVFPLPLQEESDCALSKAGDEYGVAYALMPLCSDDHVCEELTQQYQVARRISSRPAEPFEDSSGPRRPARAGRDQITVDDKSVESMVTNTLTGLQTGGARP